MSRIALALVGTLVALAVATPSHATLNACSAGKTLCVSKKTAGLLRCHQLAEAKGRDLISDPTIQACLQKATTKFDGRETPSRGCFARLEAKIPGCLTTGDTTVLGNAVDEFVANAVTALDPDYPAPVKNACSAGKKECVSKKATALLTCHSKNEMPPAGLSAATFAACLHRARDQFDGGVDATMGCFAKLEAKFPGRCLTTGDTAALETMVDGYVNDVVCQLDAGSETCPTPTPTSTLTPTPTPTATVTDTPTPTPTSTGTVQFGQIDLYTAGGFGALHQYHDVTTSLCSQVPCESSGLVTIYLPQSSATGGMQLWFGDQVNPTTNYFYSYWIDTYGGNGNPSVLQKCVFPMDATNSYSTGPCVPDGETLQVTLNETSRRVCGNGSGRGGYACHTVWTLVGGTVVR